MIAIWNNFGEATIIILLDREMEVIQKTWEMQEDTQDRDKRQRRGNAVNIQDFEA